MLMTLLILVRSWTRKIMIRTYRTKKLMSTRTQTSGRTRRVFPPITHADELLPTTDGHVLPLCRITATLTTSGIYLLELERSRLETAYVV